MKNFTITSAIFNEIEQFNLNCPENREESYHVLLELAEKELDINKENYSENEFYDMIDDKISDINVVNRIPQDGILYQALTKWHNRNDVNSYPLNLKVLENVRSAVLDGGYLYYVTGCGYDTISSDLLGGNADGETKKEFLNWINNQSSNISQWEHLDNACGSVWNALRNSRDDDEKEFLSYIFHALVSAKNKHEE